MISVIPAVTKKLLIMPFKKVNVFGSAGKRFRAEIILFARCDLSLDAEKNDDTWVSVEIYDNIDDAKKVYSDFMSDIDDELSVYRDGKVVIYGTKSAVNDARSK